MAACRIGFGEDRDGLDAEFLTGLNDPERNFTAIGYQDFLEHAGTPMWAEGRWLWRGCRINKEERLAIFHRLGAFGKNFDDPSIDLRLDFVHQLHRFDDAQNLSLF
jgi:hypothetical protein